MDVRLSSLFPSPVLHPGSVLQEVLDRYGISQGEFAQAIGVEATNLCAVIHGRRPVTLDLARQLAMALGTSPEFWLLRQLAWDLEHAEPLPRIAPLPQLSVRRLPGVRPRFRPSWNFRPFGRRRRTPRVSSGAKPAQDRPF